MVVVNIVYAYATDDPVYSHLGVRVQGTVVGLDQGGCEVVLAAEKTCPLDHGMGAGPGGGTWQDVSDVDHHQVAAAGLHW